MSAVIWGWYKLMEDHWPHHKGYTRLSEKEGAELVEKGLCAPLACEVCGALIPRPRATPRGIAARCAGCSDG